MIEYDKFSSELCFPNDLITFMVYLKLNMNVSLPHQRHNCQAQVARGPS